MAEVQEGSSGKRVLQKRVSEWRRRLSSFPGGIISGQMKEPEAGA